MKKLSTSLILVILLITACSQKPADVLELSESLKGDQKVVATVAGTKVYQSELSSYAKSRTQQEFSEMNSEVRKNLFSEFLQLETLSRKAAAIGLQNTEEFGLQVHNLKKNLLAQALLTQLEEKNPVTEAEINAEYETAKKEFQVPQIKASHILLKTEDEAKAIIAQLNKKADFVKLAKEKSTGPSGPNGGDLGWFSPSQMVKPFADAAIAMEKGTFSKTPTQTQFGWHVIKKDDERIGEAPALDNLRPRIEQKLKQQRLEKYLADLKNELMVTEIFGADAPVAAVKPDQDSESTD